MNKIAEEIRSYFGVAKDPSLLHYGKPHTASNPGSGRYPWGSGKNPQRSRGWMSRYRELKDAGINATKLSPQLLPNYTKQRNVL